FFFQAEDGIRDDLVTGVQTCALPIFNRQLRLHSRPKGLLAPGDLRLAESPVSELKDGQALARVKYLSIDPTMRVWMVADTYLPRSEERRVGKERRPQKGPRAEQDTPQ